MPECSPGRTVLLHVLDSASAKALLLGSPALDLEQLRLEALRALDSLAADVAAAGGDVSDRLLREGRVMDEMLAAAAANDLLVVKQDPQIA